MCLFEIKTHTSIQTHGRNVQDSIIEPGVSATLTHRRSVQCYKNQICKKSNYEVRNLQHLSHLLHHKLYAVMYSRRFLRITRNPVTR